MLSEKALFYQPFSEDMPIQMVCRLRWSTRCVEYLASRRQCIMLLIYQPKVADASSVSKLSWVLLTIYVKETGWTINWKQNVFSAINIFAKCTKLNLFAEIVNNKYFFFFPKMTSQFMTSSFWKVNCHHFYMYLLSKVNNNISFQKLGVKHYLIKEYLQTGKL